MLPISYRRHSFPQTVIQHAVWLYLRFTLSYHDVEELLAQRGLDLSYESVRSWVPKIGPLIARRLWLCRPGRIDRWHLDEMVVRIAGKRMYLWRAVDHEGEILDVLLQRRRDRRAAVKLMRKLLRKQGFAPKRVTTDQLRSYGAALRHLGLNCHHEQGLRQNNRAENSHQVVRRRAQDAAVQISRVNPAFPEHACCRPQHLQPSTSSRLALDPPDLPNRGGGAMAERDSRGMIRTSLHVPYRPKALNLTLPSAPVAPTDRGETGAFLPAGPRAIF